LRWFDASPRKATPKGQNLHLLHSTESNEIPTYIDLTFLVRGALKRDCVTNGSVSKTVVTERDNVRCPHWTAY